MNPFTGIFSGIGHFGITDVLDVAAVSYLIYRVMLVIRQSRAVQVAKGLVVIAVLILISNFLQLRILNWLLTRALLPGVVALIIIFQPELRTGLAQIGRGTIWGSRLKTLGGAAISEVINEILEAVAHFSREKIGALIAIERETPLTEIIEQGVQMDSKVSSTLLETIFSQYGPLHDMAVVMRGERVAAAGCLFPTSTNPYLGRTFGTRHRAAIGLSERSDAVVLVVSEETGALSVAVDGVIHTRLNLAQLKERLLGYFEPSTRSGIFGMPKPKRD
jgi:diadenylate cyclase